jgi:hypothetical protein
MKYWEGYWHLHPPIKIFGGLTPRSPLSPRPWPSPKARPPIPIGILGKALFYPNVKIRAMQIIR